MSRPPVLDVTSVLEAAFAARDTDPELFGLWLMDVYATEWHGHEQQPEDFHHYASALGECDRKYVLARSGSPREPLTVASLTTFEVGKHMHVLLQFGLAVHPDYVLLAHECGGTATRDGIMLSGRSDAVYLDPSGECCIYEFKSEREYAKGWREKEAAAAGRDHTAKPEHALQAQATAAVVHRLTDLRPTWAAVLYWSKESGRTDVQWVQLGVQPVLDALEHREEAWTDYQWSGALPPVVDDFTAPNKDRKTDIGKGLCTPRSAVDRRGVWCGHREECERLWKESQKLHVVQGAA